MSNMIQFGRRFAAFVFDRILIIMLMRPDILAVALFGEISEWWRMVLEFSSLGLVSVYVVGSHWRWGRTLGMGWSRKTGQEGSLNPNPKNDQKYVQEKPTQVQC